MTTVPYTIKKPFECVVYDTEPQDVSNPYSGETISLTPVEVAVYDTMKGAEMMGLYNTVQAGTDWFVKNNIKAYSVLLD
tara:strand:+ start:268 stop:504 length:237 start_codon:yes stop_codon:yes gene_type:complete